MKLKKRTAVVLAVLFILSSALMSPAMAVSDTERSAMTEAEREAMVREAVARTIAASEESERIMKEWAESGANQRLIPPTGCTARSKTVSGPENFTTTWSDSFEDLVIPELGVPMGTFGGKFTKIPIPLIDDTACAYVSGVTAVYGKEAFVESGGVTKWSGGYPKGDSTVNSDPVGCKNNSVWFMGSAWWGDWRP